MDRRVFLGLFTAGVGIRAATKYINSDSNADDGGPTYWSDLNWRLEKSTAYSPLSTADSDTRRVDYIWEYEGIRSATFHVPESLYQYYSNRPRTWNHGHYASHPYQNTLLDEVLEKVAIDSNRDGYPEVSSVQKFVQGLEYTSDKISTGWDDYPRYPIETLVNRGGDCEDTAILMATLLQRLGYSTVLLAFWDDQHMALGVAGTIQGFLGDGTYYTHGGRKYHYLESTNTGWEIGQQPSSITSHPEILPISGYPVVTASVTGSWNSRRNTIDVFVRLTNNGDATASNVSVGVQFANGTSYSPDKEAFVRFLSEGASESRTISFNVDELPPVTAGDTPELDIIINERGQLHDMETFKLDTA